MTPDFLHSASGVAEGFEKYGAVWGLSLALVALAVVSSLLLWAKNREAARADKRVDALELAISTASMERVADLKEIARQTTSVLEKNTQGLLAFTKQLDTVATRLEDVVKLVESTQSKRKPYSGTGGA